MSQLKEASPKIVLENFKLLSILIIDIPNSTLINSLHPHFPTYLNFCTFFLF